MRAVPVARVPARVARVASVAACACACAFCLCLQAMWYLYCSRNKPYSFSREMRILSGYSRQLGEKPNELGNYERGHRVSASRFGNVYNGKVGGKEALRVHAASSATATAVARCFCFGCVVINIRRDAHHRRNLFRTHLPA